MIAAISLWGCGMLIHFRTEFAAVRMQFIMGVGGYMLMLFCMIFSHRNIIKYAYKIAIAVAVFILMLYVRNIRVFGFSAYLPLTINQKVIFIPPLTIGAAITFLLYAKIIISVHSKHELRRKKMLSDIALAAMPLVWTVLLSAANDENFSRTALLLTGLLVIVLSRMYSMRVIILLSSITAAISAILIRFTGNIHSNFAACYRRPLSIYMTEFGIYELYHSLEIFKSNALLNCGKSASENLLHIANLNTCWSMTSAFYSGGWILVSLISVLFCAILFSAIQISRYCRSSIDRTIVLASGLILFLQFVQSFCVSAGIIPPIFCCAVPFVSKGVWNLLSSFTAVGMIISCAIITSKKRMVKTQV